MTEQEKFEISAKFQALIQQRDRAANETADAAGVIAVLNKKVEDLTKELEEVKSKLPKEE